MIVVRFQPCKGKTGCDKAISAITVIEVDGTVVILLLSTHPQYQQLLGIAGTL